jgi:hypothetical protein
MHLLIPYATSHAEACQATLPTLKLPNLEKLLLRLTAQPIDAGDELSLSPPHERALAKHLGLPTIDGQIPWAAWQARHLPELDPVKGAWAFVSLCHWQATAHQVTMRQVPMQDLPHEESVQFFAAMQPFFNEDGITLHPFEPGRWLAHGEVFSELVTASTDRVLGRNLEPWMPRATHATKLARLVSEMQMLLYTDALNDTRARRSALPVNAFWLSGAGQLPPGMPATDALSPTVISPMREAALAENWQAWAQAWHSFDADQCPAMMNALTRGESVSLTLCGERHAQTWITQPQTLKRRFLGLFGSQCIQDVLIKL